VFQNILGNPSSAWTRYLNKRDVWAQVVNLQARVFRNQGHQGVIQFPESIQSDEFAVSVIKYVEDTDQPIRNHR
jgi:hypothetical protein